MSFTDLKTCKEFYLFNRRYLYTDLSSVEQELEDEAVLEPPVEGEFLRFEAM